MTTQSAFAPEIQEAMPQALRVAVRILAAWRLNRNEAAQVLGVRPDELEVLRRVEANDQRFTAELVERTSYVLGIEKYLEILLNNEEAAIADWVNNPSYAPAFSGKSPKQVFLTSSSGALREVRDYLADVASAPFA